MSNLRFMVWIQPGWPITRVLPVSPGYLNRTLRWISHRVVRCRTDCRVSLAGYPVCYWRSDSQSVIGRQSLFTLAIICIRLVTSSSADD
jgi:hypothetical protein